MARKPEQAQKLDEAEDAGLHQIKPGMAAPKRSEFSQDICDIICERIANGESLRSICDDAAMPAKSTVFKWLIQHPLFADQYALARDAQADAFFDDILTIADDGRNDWMERRDEEGENIGWRENGEALRRSALRVDARKWMAGKLRPKKYGDKVQTELSGSITVTHEDALAQLK